VLDGAPQPAAKKRMLRIASGCATREAFVAVFRRFCDRDSIFIATKTPKPPGEELQFSITLSDGKPLMGGRGAVIESWSDDKGPFARPGMRIRFGELSPDGRALIDELVAAAEADKAREKGKPASVVPATTAAAALAAAALSRATPPPVPPRTPSAKIPVIKPLPSVIAKATEEPRKTMLGLPPLRSPSSKPEGTPRPILLPRDVEVELPPLSARAKPETDEQVTAVSSSRFARDSMMNEAASWDEAASHALNDTRVRGSDEILPANPLGGVATDSLDAFVECTIYEETGAFADGEPTAPGDGRSPDDWASGDPTIPPWLARPLPVDDDSTQVPALVRAVDLAPDDRALPVAGPPREFYVPPAPPPPARIEAAERRRGHWPITIGIAAVTCGLGILIGFLVSNPSAGEPAEKPIAAAAPVVAESDLPAPPPEPPPPPRSDEETAPPSRSEEETPPPPAAAVSPVAAVEGARCDATIKTEPDGAKVLAAGAELGKTPLEVSLPCGAQEVEIRRPRYRDETRTLELAPGKVTRLEVDLSRPEHRIRVVSVPEGARVTINGRSAGTTPVTTTVNGFEQARVNVEMSGYKEWSKRVYVRSSTTSLTARLSPDKKSEKDKSAGSRAPRRSN
jgi:hypothetical protein